MSFYFEAFIFLFVVARLKVRKIRHRFLLLGVFLRLRFLFGKHENLVDEVSNPLARETKMLVVIADGKHCFDHTWIAVVVFVEHVVHHLFGHGVEGLLKERGQAEFELHQVAGKHHDVLGETLELNKVGLYVLYFPTVLAYALVYFLEKGFVCSVDLLHHFAATALLANPKFVVECRHMKCGLEGAQIRQHGKIGNTDGRCHGCLEIYSNEGHIVFHTADTLLIGIAFLEQFR